MADGPRERLRRAWATLEARGATVRRIDLDGLTDREINVLAWAAEHRLTVITEGRQAGWIPWDEAS